MSDALLVQTMKGILGRLDQIDDIKAEIKEEYAQAKAAGFDKTALGFAIREIRGRDKAETPAAQERAVIVDLYVSTFDNAPRTYVHVPAREATDTTTLGIQPSVQSEAEAGASPEQGSTARAAGVAGHSSAHVDQFVAPAGEGEGVAASADPSPAADEPIKGLAAANAIAARAAQPSAPKVERAEIDIEIPAFLRRTNGGNHPSFGEQA